MIKNSFKDGVKNEIRQIRKKGLVSNSLHEGFGLLLEEVEEFWDEVKKKTSKRNLKNTRKELIQIAALAEIICEDNIHEKKKT